MATAKQYLYQGHVLDIHDGDTVKVQVLLRRVAKVVAVGDLGFHCHIEDLPDGHRYVTGHFPFRLLGLNAPELSTQAGKEALAYIKTLIAVGDLITVRSSVAAHDIDPDKYGDRWDGVLVRQDGLIVNNAMIDSGHAKTWNGQGTKPV